jgi:tetratricopeptide (TPR) repeat protein
MIIALTEIGDYPAALLELERAGDRPPDLVKEEHNAVLASARRRFDDLREIGRALTAEGRLDEAQREWDALKEFWPGADLALGAQEERNYLIKEAGFFRDQKAKRDRERAGERMLVKLRELGRRILLEERYDFDAQSKEIEEFLRGISKEDAAPIGDLIGACREIVRCRHALFRRGQEVLDRRHGSLPLARITARFGPGDVTGLEESGLIVRRTGDTLDRIPLSRLDGQEKMRLFGLVPRRPSGAEAMATGLFCLSWGLREQADEQFQSAMGINPTQEHFVDLVKQLSREE